MIKTLFFAYLICKVLTYAQSDINEKDTIELNQEELLEDILEDESSILDLLEPEFKKIGERVLSRPNINVRSRIKEKLQKSRGYEEKVFLGSPLYSYQRFRMGNKIIEGALLLKKDPGEKSYSDFINYYFQIENLFNIKKVIFGDYIVEAGQGLCFWRNYYFSKGVGFTKSLIRYGKELQPYNSSDEIGFLRGLASQVEFNDLNITTFYSYRLLTASIDTNGYVKNFYSQYFRTLKDLDRKNNTEEKVLGARIFYKMDEHKVGINICKIDYSRIVKKNNTSNYLNFGLDYLMDMNTMSLSVESYFNNMRYLNSILALRLTPRKIFSYFVSYRNYSLYTFNRFSNPFGEDSKGSNEVGFFNGITFKISRYFTVNGYLDMFKSHFTEKMNCQRAGKEYFVQINANIIKKMLFIFRYRNKIYDDQAKQLDHYGREIKLNDLFKKYSFRFNLDYQIHSKVKYRLRAEYLNLTADNRGGTESGRLLYHDIYFRVFYSLILNFRITVFSTSSFSSGISTYENDLDGVLTNPVLYGKGFKWYFLVKYNIREKFLVAIKYSHLIREDTRKIGSGWDQLPSNVDNRIAMQVDINL